MKDQCCTEEQMNTLAQLGIDVSNASMTFSEIYDLERDTPTERTLTVADMLDMLPESIKDNYNRINYYFDLLVLKSNRRYSCIYVNKHLKQTIYSSGDYLLLRDALFDILVQLKKDNKFLI